MQSEEQQQVSFETCARELYPMLWRLSGAYASGSDRDDLVQEMLLAIWKRLASFSGRSKLSTWGWRVAFYTAMNWRRKRDRQPRNEPLEMAPEVGDNRSAARDKLDRVYQALRSLPEVDRSVLLMALEEMSRSEMAANLGISENAAQVRLHRARQRLAEEMERTES
jgi:RNA polymerase sigma-70 factor (ECF subfamily)